MEDWEERSRLVPPLPAFVYPERSVLPEGGPGEDVPISWYRHRRLLRALGELPAQAIGPRPIAGAARDPGGRGCCRGQFAGDLRVATWNSRALFCKEGPRRDRKMRYLRKLLLRTDVVLLTECHGTGGLYDAYRPPRGWVARFSAGVSAGHAGVGMMIRESFLDRFDTREWRPFWPGRAAKMALRGREGSLDLIVSYYPTGDEVAEADTFGAPAGRVHEAVNFPALRGIMRDCVAAEVANKETVLTVMGGDFNWAARDSDRRAMTTGVAGGARDRGEERHFEVTLGARHSLHEMHQPEETYTSRRSRVRLDRIYSNHHIVDQLDHVFQAVALEWPGWDCSDHRAVLFSRRAAVHLPGERCFQRRR